MQSDPEPGTTFRGPNWPTTGVRKGDIYIQDHFGQPLTFYYAKSVSDDAVEWTLLPQQYPEQWLKNLNQEPTNLDIQSNIIYPPPIQPDPSPSIPFDWILITVLCLAVFIKFFVENRSIGMPKKRRTH